MHTTVMILSFRTDMPGQTVQTQISSVIRVYTVCHSVCIVWTHYSMVEPHSSNFRMITTNFLGVRIFRKFMVMHLQNAQNFASLHRNSCLVCIVCLRYCKFPKYLDTQKICCNHSKIWTMWLYHTVMSPNNADKMANSVDPDQTAPLEAVWSGSAHFAQTYLTENLGSLRQC